MEVDLLPDSLNVIKSLVFSKAKIFLNFTVSVPRNGSGWKKIGRCWIVKGGAVK